MAVRVFLSYAHESDEHASIVRELWLLLRSCGVDAVWDGVAAQSRRDWALWMGDQVRAADFVLVIASAAYRERAEGRVVEGRGVQWEARLIRDAFYADQVRGIERFVPVVVPGQTVAGVPDFLAPASSTVYEVPSLTLPGVESLLRFLLDQPAEIEPPLGPVPEFGRPSVERLPAGSEVFVGRVDELARLEAAVASSGRAVVVAVHGLGGVGKSTLAARFARLHADRFSPTWWITADSPTALDAGLADLAAEVVPGELPSEQRADAAVRWLTGHDGWLLVLDNLTAPADAARLLARVRTGTIVITSRRGSGWRGLAESVALAVLSPAEALDLLERCVRVEWPDADLTGGAELCAELGFLPLAVEQAGAYLAQARITPTAYLDLLARFPARMFTATAEGGEAERTVARVWKVTLDRLADTPLAGDLLRIMAWFAPEAIPRHLFDVNPDHVAVVEALGRLAAHSMITLDRDTIAVHRLVQAVSRTSDPADPHRDADDISEALEVATDLLAHVLSGLDHENPEDRPVYRVLLPHARALLDRVEVDGLAACRVLDRIGRYLAGAGDTAGALAYHARAVRGMSVLVGEEHPETLVARCGLAVARMAAGDHGGAIESLRVLDADAARLLGPSHPDVLVVRHELALAYGLAGDHDQAIALSRAVLDDVVRIFGADHPRTLACRNNLAAMYQYVGDHDRAISVLETIVAEAGRSSGVDGHLTLTGRANLATALLKRDPHRAIPILEQVLEEVDRRYGSDNPNTLVCRNNLAGAYLEVDDLDRAISLFESVLVDRRRVLGDGHPDTRETEMILTLARRVRESGGPAGSGAPR
ncbi:FxSxx-COOH system tetratricopeptide repeat protein [Saccharothrix violaceirubra]|uniref:SEFIR domain-containing protein n=1 Tax=Saccharothrix violaceirubra TaxID=413306 RepID=A0A7W7WV82_9PSEU|nr:tetratricopeptide repeat protein [Saccharothrix violaceirubra]MBB4964263.1 hypothetical protein [Saccharothrix violaceirubra]